MMVWDEVNPNSHISISVAAAQDKAADVRQLVQASSGASPNLALEVPCTLPLKAF